jgi:DNA-binding NtrC family response regulator
MPPQFLKEGMRFKTMNDPEMKTEEVPVAGKSGWNIQQNAASASPKPGYIAEWPIGGLPFSLRTMRAQAEIYAITRALEEAGWNRKRAAKMLRISYRGLLYKISSHKITRANGKGESLGAEPQVAFAAEQIK